MLDKRTIKLALKISISILLILYLSFKVDWHIIYEALQVIEVKAYLISTLMVVIAIFILNLKYLVLIRGTDISMPLLSLVKIYVTARFYSFFLPSSISNEAIRWYKVTKNEKGRAFFLAAIFFEKAVALFILLLTCLIPLLLYTDNTGLTAFRDSVLPFIYAALLVSLVSITYFLFPSLQSLFRSAILKFLPSSEKWQKIDSIAQNFHIKGTSTARSLKIFALSILWQLIFVLRIYFLVAALNVPLGITDVAWIGSLVLLLQALPVTFAGLGLREGAYAYLFVIFNLLPEYGVLTGVLFFSQALLVILTGGLIELLEK